jgi:RimJ/RimL family protein N-acetyltransferase
MGVRKQFQGSVMGAALTLLLFQFLRNGLLEEGFKRVEMSWVLEDNLPMRRLIEDLGARPYKTYRLYEKALA